MDYSKKMLDVARANKAYKSLERVVFGQPSTVIPEEHLNAYDFVVAPSLINNNDHDSLIFENLISCLKMGGFAIFATKLDYSGDDQYKDIIADLTE